MTLSENNAQPNRSTQLAASLKITSITLVGLVIFFFVEFAQASTQHWISLFVEVLPLIAFQVAFRKQNPKAYAWFCFLLLIYFIFLMPLLNATNSWIDWVQLLLTVICFISSMMNVRWLKRESQLSSLVNH